MRVVVRQGFYCTGMYTLYCSLIQPYISYCNEIWGNNYASNVKCLCTIQSKAVRLICNADRLAHTNVLFKELYILKFLEFVPYKPAILFHGTLPIHLQNTFTIYSTTRSARRCYGSSKNQHKKSDVPFCIIWCKTMQFVIE